MIRTLAFVFLIGASLATAADLGKDIERILRASQKTPDTGFAIVIIKEGKVVLSQGYGYRDRETKRRVTPDTLFGIASNSKAFTAALLKMLEEDKQLDLERPVRDYLSDFALSNGTAGEQATAEDLLTHRTGLPRHDFLWYLTPLSRENLFYRLPFLSPNPAPNAGFRQGFQYNNLMYMAAGYLAEKVTNQSWDSLMHSRFFTPLGMDQTNTSVGELKNKTDVALPYWGNKKLEFKNVDNVAPAASINSSANDLAKWVSCLLAEGKTAEGEQLLSPKAIASLFMPRVEFMHQGLKTNYGLGWFLNKVRGHRLIWHGGALPGYSSLVSFMPEKELGVVILSNQLMEQSVYFEIPIRIYDLLLGMEWGKEDAEAKALPPFTTPLENMFEDLSPPTPMASRWKAVDLLTDPKLSEYHGVYLDRGYGPITIGTAPDKKLYASYYENSFELTPDGGTTFAISLKGTWLEGSIPVRFISDGKKFVALTIPFEPAVKPIRFNRLMEP